MIQVALVGIGGMGAIHYNAYSDLAGVKVIAVADVRPDMAREKVQDESVHIYASLEELLEYETPDVVDICTPSYLHAELSVYALERGCHVLCEKPMSLSSKETSAMIAAAEASGKFFMTAHVVRFMENYKYLRSVIESGELGKPVHFDMKRLSGIPLWSWEDWMRDLSKSGGTPIDLSIHDLDFIQDIFGQPKSVSGVYHKMNQNFDFITSQLLYDGFDITVTGGWFDNSIPFRAEYLAIFEKGYVELASGKLVKNGEPVTIEIGKTSDDTGINLTGADGYSDEIAYFIECVKENKKPVRVTPKSSEDSVKLVERILANSVIQ